MSSRKPFLFLALTLSGAVTLVSGQNARLNSTGANLSISQNMEGIRLPVWSGDALVVELGMARAPTSFLVYDRSGKLLQNLPFDIPGGSHTIIHNAAWGTDGTLAVCGLSYAADGKGAPYIALLPSDGGSLNIIRTEPYTPNVITIASDGTIWTVGYELNEDRGEESGVDMNAGVVRHFDRSGKTLGTFIPRSSLKTAVLTGSTRSRLASAGSRVGWFSFYDSEGGYVEFSNSGGFSKYRLPEIPNMKGTIEGQGLAITDSGDVYVSVYDSSAHTRPLIYRLDRKTAKWQPVALPNTTVRSAMLYCASGTDLVLRFPEDAASTFRFLTPVN